MHRSVGRWLPCRPDITRSGDNNGLERGRGAMSGNKRKGGKERNQFCLHFTQTEFERLN